LVSRIVNHPLSPFTKRAFYAILVLAIVMAIGTGGLMLIEGWNVVDSFYFMSLLATAEGPALSPATAAGKIFASVMAFFSIGAAISAITFTFGPLFGSALKEGLRYVEKEEEKLKDRIDHKKPDAKSASSQIEE
jgi:voltage-gated potassium channel